MPFVPNTPESLIARSDSKNPSSTCRGITASGRPCRRSVGASNRNNSLLPHAGRPRTPDPGHEGLYCWQHKEQASLSSHSSPGPRSTATPILEEQRTSLDTLADRLGLVDLQDKDKQTKTHHKRRDSQTHGHHSTGGYKHGRPGKRQKGKPRLEFCFCFTVPLEEVNEPGAPVRRPPQPAQRTSAPGRKSRYQQQPSATPTASPGKSSSRSTTASQTARLKDRIPNDLGTAAASALLSELARPYVESEEPGYIYMFWLAPTSVSRGSAVPVDAARDMLAPPPRSPRSRRPSDLVSSFADSRNGGSTKTMILKIGRAANVQRRMNQWQRQCGRDVEVLRYYPYAPSGGALAPPRTIPHPHRVERLVHIELAGRGLQADRGACATCGREHREWFEVEASRAAVREVDGVIRRWVEWDQGNTCNHETEH